MKPFIEKSIDIVLKAAVMENASGDVYQTFVEIVACLKEALKNPNIQEANKAVLSDAVITNFAKLPNSQKVSYLVKTCLWIYC